MNSKRLHGHHRAAGSSYGAARLDQLAQLTGRTKAFYLRQLIEAGLDDLEDAVLGAAVAERIRWARSAPPALTMW
ncbi:MAG: hypothetical protein ACKOPS_12255 [Cyanobium sp.]